MKVTNQAFGQSTVLLVVFALFITSCKQKEEDNKEEGPKNPFANCLTFNDCELDCPKGAEIKRQEKAWKEEVACYKDDQKHGPLVLWMNSTRFVDCEFKDGKEHGTWISWHNNGQKSDEAQYVEGKRHGPSTAWHENGQKSKEGENRYGKPCGIIQHWNDKGKERSCSDDEKFCQAVHAMYVANNGCVVKDKSIECPPCENFNKSLAKRDTSTPKKALIGHWMKEGDLFHHFYFSEASELFWHNANKMKTFEGTWIDMTREAKKKEPRLKVDLAVMSMFSKADTSMWMITFSNNFSKMEVNIVNEKNMTKMNFIYQDTKTQPSPK